MKRMAGMVLGLLTCGMLAPPAASAQAPGERVRVTLSTAERIVGVFVESRPDELVLDPQAEGRGLRSITHDEILRLERSLGGRSRWKQGLVFGALGGAALGVGAGLGLFGEVTCGGNLLDPGRPCTGESHVVWGAAVGFGVVGAVVGTVSGVLVRREGWETIENWTSRGIAPGLVLDVRPGPKGRTSFLIGGRLRL